MIYKYIVAGIALVGFFFMYNREVRKNEQLELSVKQYKTLYEDKLKETEKLNKVLEQRESEKQELFKELEEKKSNAKTTVRKTDKTWAETPVPASAINAISVRKQGRSASDKKSKRTSDSAK